MAATHLLVLSSQPSSSEMSSTSGRYSLRRYAFRAIIFKFTIIEVRWLDMDTPCGYQRMLEETDKICSFVCRNKIKVINNGWMGGWINLCTFHKKKVRVLHYFWAPYQTLHPKKVHKVNEGPRRSKKVLKSP